MRGLFCAIVALLVVVIATIKIDGVSAHTMIVCSNKLGTLCAGTRSGTTPYTHFWTPKAQAMPSRATTAGKVKPNANNARQALYADLLNRQRRVVDNKGHATKTNVAVVARTNGQITPMWTTNNHSPTGNGMDFYLISSSTVQDPAPFQPDLPTFGGPVGPMARLPFAAAGKCMSATRGGSGPFDKILSAAPAGEQENKLCSGTINLPQLDTGLHRVVMRWGCCAGTNDATRAIDAVFYDEFWLQAVDDCLQARTEYLRMYPDLVAAGKRQSTAFTHYQSWGFKENRKWPGHVCASSPTNCPAAQQKYYTRYPDVKKAYNNVLSRAIVHYGTHGFNEGRVWDRTVCAIRCVASGRAYLTKYSDVARVYGRKNWRAAYVHYQRFGKKEGRAWDSSQCNGMRSALFGGNLAFVMEADDDADVGKTNEQVNSMINEPKPFDPSMVLPESNPVMVFKRFNELTPPPPPTGFTSRPVDVVDDGAKAISPSPSLNTEHLKAVQARLDKLHESVQRVEAAQAAQQRDTAAVSSAPAHDNDNKQSDMPFKALVIAMSAFGVVIIAICIIGLCFVMRGRSEQGLQKFQKLVSQRGGDDEGLRMTAVAPVQRYNRNPSVVVGQKAAHKRGTSIDVIQQNIIDHMMSPEVSRVSNC